MACPWSVILFSEFASLFFYLQVYLNGYHGDCSKMFEVDECDDEAKRLISMTELCLKSAIDICKPNENFSSIGNRNN